MDGTQNFPVLGLYGSDAQRSAPYCAICEEQTNGVILIEGRQVCAKVRCRERARKSSEAESKERARHNRLSAENARARTVRGRD